MWQKAQVGARGVVASAFAGSLNQSPSALLPVPLRARSACTRMPCLEVEYISHCGWSKPMWQVAQASGRRASAAEKVWRVWQESHLPPSEPIRWQPPHPFIPSMIAFGWSFVVGMAVRATQAFGVLALLELGDLLAVALGADPRRDGRDDAGLLAGAGLLRDVALQVALVAGHPLRGVLRHGEVAQGAPGDSHLHVAGDAVAGRLRLGSRGPGRRSQQGRGEPEGEGAERFHDGLSSPFSNGPGRTLRRGSVRGV